MPAPKDVTPERWTHVVTTFAKHNGRISLVAAELGWTVRRTERAFYRGYPSIGYPPVRTALARDSLGTGEVRAERSRIEANRARVERVEQAELEKLVNHVARVEEVATNEKRRPAEKRLDKEAARAERQRQAALSLEEQKRMVMLLKREEDRERARADAVKSRGEEAVLVSSSRRNALALNAVTAQVLRGAVALSAKIQTALEQEATASTLTLGQQLALVRQASQIARFNAEASLQAVKSERLALGQSSLGDSEVELTGSLEDAGRWIETSLRALQRAKDRGLIAIGFVTPGIQLGDPQSVSPGLQTAVVEQLIESEPPKQERAALPTASEERSTARARVRTRRTIGTKLRAV